MPSKIVKIVIAIFMRYYSSEQSHQSLSEVPARQCGIVVAT